jgi:serine/threonine protein kinase
MDILSEEYEIREKLGQGQFGEVFKIIRKIDGCVFAAKQLRREPTAIEWARDDTYF